MFRLAFDFIITWRETRTRPNAYEEAGRTHYIFYYIIPCCLFIMLLIISVLLRWLFSCLYNILSQLLQNDNF